MSASSLKDLRRFPPRKPNGDSAHKGAPKFNHRKPAHARRRTFIEIRDRLISIKKNVAIVEAALEELLQLSDVGDDPWKAIEEKEISNGS